MLTGDHNCSERLRRESRLIKTQMSVVALGFVFVLVLFCVAATCLKAQVEAEAARRLGARELNYLVALAREPLNALTESRTVRQPRDNAAMPFLNQSHPLAVTLWLDGGILARSVEIRQPLPLAQGAMILGARVLDSPDAGRVPTAEEWPKVKIAVAVMRKLAEVADDSEISAGQAVVVVNGFKIAVGFPGDLPKNASVYDLLGKTCELFGLRSSSWLSERSSLLSAVVDEMLEK
ncbi:MAG: hypothetical protein LBO05_10120 [Deltaproteobacteria bacterium]|jgi:hypothetical protein|nr:hypothetical protein [Deltaproteobacteria bacterium]